MVRICETCKESEVDFSRETSKNCKSCTDKKRGNLYSNKNRSIGFKNKYKVPSIITYAFKDGDKIVYVGSTNNGGYRIWEHYYDKVKSFCRDLDPIRRELKYTYHVLWHGDSLEDAVHMEKLNIQTHQPKFNQIKYKTYEG